MSASSSLRVSVTVPYPVLPPPCIAVPASRTCTLCKQQPYGEGGRGKRLTKFALRLAFDQYSLWQMHPAIVTEKYDCSRHGEGTGTRSAYSKDGTGGHR